MCKEKRKSKRKIKYIEERNVRERESREVRKRREFARQRERHKKST